MRAVRLLAAIVSAIIGGYLLLMANRIAGEIRNQTQGWHFFPLPSHPKARIVAYLVLAIALQLGHDLDGLPDPISVTVDTNPVGEPTPDPIASIFESLS